MGPHLADSQSFPAHPFRCLVQSLSSRFQSQEQKKRRRAPLLSHTDHQNTHTETQERRPSSEPDDDSYCHRRPSIRPTRTSESNWVMAGCLPLQGLERLDDLLRVLLHLGLHVGEHLDELPVLSRSACISVWMWMRSTAKKRREGCVCICVCTDQGVEGAPQPSTHIHRRVPRAPKERTGEMMYVWRLEKRPRKGMSRAEP